MPLERRRSQKQRSLVNAPLIVLSINRGARRSNGKVVGRITGLLCHGGLRGCGSARELAKFRWGLEKTSAAAETQ